jgi:electron transport complex protein RnfE
MKSAGMPSRLQAGRDRLTLLFLGLCPAIAVSSRVIDALWMSAGVILVAVLSALAMSLLAKSASGDAESASGDAESGLGGATRQWLGALVITSFLTASFEAALLALLPGASAALGIYAPLISVNCLVVGWGMNSGPRAALGKAAAAALRRGFGFAAVLVFLSLVREALGAGTVTLFAAGSFAGTLVIPRLVEQPVRAVGLAGGGLLCLGYFAGAARAIARARAPRAGGGAAR